MFAAFSPCPNTDVHERSSLLGTMTPYSSIPKKKNQRLSSATAHHATVFVATEGSNQFLFSMAHIHTFLIREKVDATN